MDTSIARTASGYLTGHFLVAMPGMEYPRFHKTVIYMCAHTPENAMGLICTTGQGGTCSEGKPGKLTVVTPTDADKALLDKATQESVLARWAKRCGAECAKAWTDSVGKLTGLVAAP